MAASSTHNGRDLSGMTVGNWIRAMTLKISPCGAPPTLSGLLKGVDYVIDQKHKGVPISVVNLSFDMQPYPLFKQAILKLQDNDILVVAAAANDGRDINTTPYAPAVFRRDPEVRNVLLVGNITRDGLRHPRSNYGIGSLGVDIAAPAGDIPIVPLQGSAIGNGTSFGAPMASTAIAWIRALSPELSYREARERLLDGATIHAPLANTFDGGRILNFEAALLERSPKIMAQPVLRSFSVGGK